jgi:hypothetical protein
MGTCIATGITFIADPSSVSGSSLGSPRVRSMFLEPSSDIIRKQKNYKSDDKDKNSNKVGGRELLELGRCFEFLRLE